MGFFDFIATSAKDAFLRKSEQKFEEYKNIAYELNEWIPQITNNWEKVIAIMALYDSALYDSGARSKAIDFIERFKLPKSSFERFATHPRMGEAARGIVRSINNGYRYY